jgi:hypothetical protein
MRMRLATLLIALALFAGCGEDDEQPAAPSGSLAELTVEVDPDGPDAKPARQGTISCDAPEDSEVCRALADVKPETFEPTPADVACTQQYGGPETATVKGTLRGEPVDATFSRENGCQIARWQDAAAILDAAR